MHSVYTIQNINRTNKTKLKESLKDDKQSWSAEKRKKAIENQRVIRSCETDDSKEKRLAKRRENYLQKKKQGNERELKAMKMLRTIQLLIQICSTKCHQDILKCLRNTNS